MIVRTRLWQLYSLATLLSALSTSSALANPPATDIDFDVSLRGTGSGSIHANIYTNPANRGVTTILAVHGLTGTGATFKPLATAIFADSLLGRAVKRVIAIDLPGHGESSIPTLPSPLLFTNLTIEDNVSVVIQSIDALRTRGLGAQVIMGHSMGGLAVQAAQETLLASGSSLAKHGIVGAILLAAVPNRGSQWTQPPAADVTPFLVTTAALGTYLDLPPAAAQAAGTWTNLAGSIVSDAPTPAQLAANDWVGIEPLTTLVELTGTTAPTWRPTARQGAFAIHNGTVLSVISFSQDVLAPAVDQGPLYQYLTGSSGPLYRPIVAADAVHGMYISNPNGLLTALRNGVF
jgi:pimeloyl-ACP methyl ester carboxylesterase